MKLKQLIGGLKMFPNRYLCEVIEEMRGCCKSLNFSYLLGLIEEVQSMGNRMEAKLSDMEDHERLLKERNELNEEIKELRKEKGELEK